MSRSPESLALDIDGLVWSVAELPAADPDAALRLNAAALRLAEATAEVLRATARRGVTGHMRAAER